MSSCDKKVCIGIDLGTTNSCLAYYNPENDNIEIISNLDGERITPSTYFLSPYGEEIIGKNAYEAYKNYTENDTDNNQDNSLSYPCITHVKRFIGQKHQDCLEAIEMLDYEVTHDHNDCSLIPIGDRKYKPEEISSKILKYLKDCAETSLNISITDVVVTVPAYFNDSQRRATKDACTLAGLNCLRLVAEPTAACLCYGLHKSDEETVLVFDLGGGTLDVSILRLYGGIFEVVATSGNTQLGGADIDYLLTQFLESQYKNQTSNSDYEIPQHVAENAKKMLSNIQQTIIRLPNFKYTLTRAKFEEIIHEFVEACMEPVDLVLKDAEMTNDDISQIVLVGGSTRVPIVQQTLQQMFNNKPLNKSVNPDEAVAYGAAVQASIIQKVGSKCKDLLLLDVNPLSLGIETNGGIMNTLIKRNSTLPCEATKVFSTVDDNQESVDIKVFQGEREFTRNNIKIGTFTLEGLPRAARGVPKIVVTFKLNCDGLLEVSAVDKNTGLANSITVNSDGNLSEQEIEKLLKEAEANKARDYNKRLALEEMNRFEKYVNEFQRQVNLPEMQTLLGTQQLSLVNQYLMNTMDWIVANREDADLDTIKNARSDVEFNLKDTTNQMYSHKEQMEKSGLHMHNSQNDEKQQSVENINNLIEDMCKDLKI